VAGNTFVDFDEGLNTAIKKLRYALGDSPDNPTFVATITRRGYRFIAPVKASGNASSIAPSHAAAVAELTSPKASRWKLATAVLGIVLAIALATSLISRIGWWNRSTSTIHSIAVLPLESLSGDASQDYFADGMTDELIADLGQVNALRVISRTSVMQYKNVHKPLPQIARELKVDAVVEGTVLRSGDRVRITAQLIQASSDRHLWAHTYEGDLRDVLGLQNEVAQAVATEVRVRLTSEDRQQLSRSPSVNPKAVDAYLKARYFHAQDGIEALNKSLQYSEEAIKEDPTYAAAYAELSRIYIWLGHTLLLPPHEAFSKAKAAALKAVEVDQTLAEAHADLADVHFLYDWDWFEAEKEFQRAIQLSPSTVSAHSNYSAFLLAMGRPNEAMREAKLSPWRPTHP